LDRNGQVKLRHGATEVRLEQAPFPLYPGERMKGKVTELKIVPYNEALRLEAMDDVWVEDENGEKMFKKAGDKWMFIGPNTYIPQENVKIESSAKATIVKPGEGLLIEALYDFIDRSGVERYTGENWLYFEEGAFIPNVQERVVQKITPYILTDKKALHVEAIHNFFEGERERKAGDQWLVTRDDADEYIPHVSARVVNQNVNIITLNRRSWCYLTNPFNLETNQNDYGTKVMLKGELNFFPHPHEEIGPINEVTVLTAIEALLVSAQENFVDEAGENKVAGQRWLEYGPKEYWPPVQVNIIRRVPAIIAIESAEFYVFKSEVVVLAGIAVVVVLALIYGIVF